MTIDDLSEMATTLLAISLASERLVTLAKTTFPSSLAIEKKDDTTGEVDLKRDQSRRLTIIALSIISSWITAAFLVDGGFDLMGKIAFGKGGMPVILIGLLASGGSALWGNVLEYTKAVKDIQTQRKATETLDLKKTIQLDNNGNTENQQPFDQSLLNLVDTLPPPSLYLTQSRVKRS